MEVINDGYMMLLDELIVGGKAIGNISEDGMEWGGDKPEFKKLMAAQKRSAPVKKVLTKPGTNVMTFKVIQLVAENMVDVAGGTATGEKWDAPIDVVAIEAPAEIKTGTGQTIKIKKVSLSGLVRGKLGQDGNLYLDCEMEFIAPSDKSSPFSIEPTTPGVSVAESALSFDKEGGTRVVRVSASGAVNVSAPAAGFTVTRDGNYLVISAAENTGAAAKNATLTVSLASDAAKKAEISLTQAK